MRARRAVFVVSLGLAAAGAWPLPAGAGAHGALSHEAEDPVPPVNVDTGFNVFCSGLAHLMDGSIFVAGGNKDQQLNGIVKTHLFNPVTNTWSLGPDMAAGRWYPSVTPLDNGEMLITEGGPDI